VLTWSHVCKVTEDWTHAVTEEVREFDSGQLNGLSLSLSLLVRCFTYWNGFQCPTMKNWQTQYQWIINMIDPLL